MLTLKKMQKDYTKKIGELEVEKESAESRALQSKQYLEELERSLNELE